MVCVAHHTLLPQAAELANQIVSRYADRCQWWLANESTLAHETGDDRLGHTDLIITIGGDGTILRGMHAGSLHQIPVLGVNMGRVGFMSEIDSHDALDEIAWFLDGNGTVDARAMLEARLCSGAEESLHALNDVTVHRGGELRVIEVTAVIDGVELSTYRGDGVVVATPTGSTGYTLQLGAPVIDPNAPVFMLKPIAGHMSQFGGVVINANSTLDLTVQTTADATLTVDGYISRVMSDGSRVRISKSKREAKFLRKTPGNSFWMGLSHRLGMRMGAVRRGEEVVS